MKLKKEYNDSGTLVNYALILEDGQRSASQMPATVAEEIVQRAAEVTETGEKGYELCVDDEMLFPKDIFEFAEGEEVTRPKAHAKRTSKRRSEE